MVLLSIEYKSLWCLIDCSIHEKGKGLMLNIMVFMIVELMQNIMVFMILQLMIVWITSLVDEL